MLILVSIHSPFAMWNIPGEHVSRLRREFPRHTFLHATGDLQSLAPEAGGYRIAARVRTEARTGVEMEALTAVSVAALTIYDMVKAVDKEMVIESIRLIEKRKEPIEARR